MNQWKRCKRKVQAWRRRKKWRIWVGILKKSFNFLTLLHRQATNDPVERWQPWRGKWKLCFCIENLKIYRSYSLTILMQRNNEIGNVKAIKISEKKVKREAQKSDDSPLLGAFRWRSKDWEREREREREGPNNTKIWMLIRK